LNRLEPDSHPPRLRAVGAAFMRVLALGCGASALAAAAGYLELAEFLGVGLFYALFVSFVLLAVCVVIEHVVTLGLARGPAKRLHAIARHRALLERRVRRALDLTVLGLWMWILLGHFDLLAPVSAVLRNVLDARLQVGELDLPVARVLGFVAVVVGVYLITRLVMLVLEEDVYSRMTLPRGVPYALSALTRYGLLLTGFLLALGTLGFDLTRITVLLSALGLGIGFGLQQIMNNFISGLILLFERPVQVGDSIQLGDLGGDVLRIGMRSSTLQTPQGAEVIVPNSTIIQEKVTNWTLSDRRRRIDLDIGVTGDTDPERIIALLGDIARRDPRVSSDPPPEALLMRFGEASADYQLRIWTDEQEWMRLRSDLAVALQRALRAVRVQDSAPPGREGEGVVTGPQVQRPRAEIVKGWASSPISANSNPIPTCT
jgi:potassium-dependent mechanosensitive channel